MFILSKLSKWAMKLKIWNRFEIVNFWTFSDWNLKGSSIGAVGIDLRPLSVRGKVWRESTQFWFCLRVGWWECFLWNAPWVFSEEVIRFNTISWISVISCFCWERCSLHLRNRSRSVLTGTSLPLATLFWFCSTLEICKNACLHAKNCIKILKPPPSSSCELD